MALAAAARDLSPSDARIAALERSLSEQSPARSIAPPATAAATATNSLANATALGRTRLAERRSPDPPGDSAKDHLLERVGAANANDAEVQRLLAELKDRLIAAGRQKALGQQDFDGASKSLAAALDLGVRGSEDLLASTQSDLEKQRADADFKKNVISAGSRKTHANRSSRLSGGSAALWCHRAGRPAITVTVTGTVEDITVMGAEPQRYSTRPLLLPVKGWRFRRSSAQVALFHSVPRPASASTSPTE